MANVISVAGAVGRDRDRKEREPTIMEQVLQGLQIANNAYGLKSQYDQNQRADESLGLQKEAGKRADDSAQLAKEAASRDAEESARKIAADDRKKAGIILPEEKAKYAESYIFSKVQPKDASQAAKVTVPGDDSYWMTPKPAAVAAKARKTAWRQDLDDPDAPGTPIDALVDDETGEIIKKYKRSAAGSKSEKPETLFVPEYNAKARSAAEAKEFREDIAGTQDAIALLEDIKSVGKDISPLDPRDLGKIDQIEGNIVRAIGKMRLSVVGPGAMTEDERKSIRTIIGDPSKLLSTEAREMAKLDRVIADMKKSLDRKAQQVLIFPEGQGPAKPQVPNLDDFSLEELEQARALREAGRRK